MKPASFTQVTVDTTVQEKSIAFPSDGRLYHKGRVWLVRLAAKHYGIELRQSDVGKDKQALFMQLRYAAARQMHRAARRTEALEGVYVASKGISCASWCENQRLCKSDLQSYSPESRNDSCSKVMITTSFTACMHQRSRVSRKGRHPRNTSSASR